MAVIQRDCWNTNVGRQMQMIIYSPPPHLGKASSQTPEEDVITWYSVIADLSVNLFAHVTEERLGMNPATQKASHCNKTIV